MGDEVMNRYGDDKSVILSHYMNALSSHGDSAQGVSWGSEESQETRFRVFKDVIGLDGRSILDVGCGLGHFYAYLVRYLIHPSLYLGIDICEESIRKAHRIHCNEACARFVVHDMLQDSLLCEKEFDWVIESGIFNLEIPHWEEFTFDTLRAMWRVCRLGIGVNLVSDRSPFERNDRTHYASPTRLFDFVTQEMSTKVRLLHDYLPNDFTLIVCREQT